MFFVIIRAIDSLKGKTALDLFNTNKDDMIDLIGRDEGIQLYDELQVQNGAKSVSNKSLIQALHCPNTSRCTYLLTNIPISYRS